MSDKEFGVKFIKTDNGFKIDVSCNEEIVNAHHEMVDAWREFKRKAREVAKAHHRHHSHSHRGCCDHEVKKETTVVKAE